MFLDKIWRFSQVHGATPLARLLSGRQQLAGHASLCGLNVKSSVRCCSQPYQLSSSFRSLCVHGKLKCWAKFVVACSWCSTRPVPAQSWNNLHTKSGVCVRSVKVCLRFPNWVGMNRPSHNQIIHPCFVMGKKKHQKPSSRAQHHLKQQPGDRSSAFNLKITVHWFLKNTITIQWVLILQNFMHFPVQLCIDVISWTCYPIYCVHGAEKSKSTPAPGLGT